MKGVWSMSKTKAIALCIVLLALVGADAYTYQCYQDERAANENLTRENQKLRGHVELLAGKSLDLMKRLEAANDRAEALLSK